jgi:excisionase family DNA binding protein
VNVSIENSGAGPAVTPSKTETSADDARVTSRRRELDDYAELLTVAEVSEFLRLRGRSVVDAMVRRGDLASVRVGRLVRIPRWSVARLISGK